jgi:hypothetical protein
VSPVAIDAHGNVARDGNALGSRLPRKSEQVVERLALALPDALRVDRVEIGERHDRGDRLAGSLDDDPIAGGGGVDDFPEPGSHLEGTHHSHGTSIAL